MEQSPGALTTGTKSISDWLIASPKSPEDWNAYDLLLPTIQDKFCDESFKPADTSISKQPEKYKKAQNSIWKRGEEIFGNKLFLFQDGITATDINQGSLSDCYFLSTLSALAHQCQNHIRKLFVYPKINKFGCYGVWLCHDGEWRQVIVDDFFPCNPKNKPLFSKANGNEIWVLLLEKAFAKTYGTYDKIEIGFSNCAHRDLTGAPAVFYNHKETTPEEADRIFKIIEKALNQKFVVTTSSKSSDQGLESENEKGVVSSHCYSILSFAKIQDKKGNNVNLLQLRNPWGKKEWQGDWGDNSDCWTPELREKLNVQEGNDGIFWISTTDFIKEYSSTTVGYMYPNYFYSSFNLNDIPKKEAYTTRFVKLTNKHAKNHCFISVSQVDKRSYLKEKGPYSYSHLKLVVCQYDPTTQKPVRFIEASGSAERDVFIECTLEVNEVYSIYVETEWEQELSRKLVVSAFSQNPTQLGELEVPASNSYSYLESTVAVHSTGAKNKVQEYKHGLKRIQGNFGGIIYFHYVNPTDNFTLKEEFTMKGLKNLVVYPPRTDNEKNTVEVKPNSTTGLIYRVQKAGGFAFNFSTTYSMKS